MEKPIPDTDQADLLHLYARLAEITKQQAEIVALGNGGKVIDTYNQLSQDWAEIAASIGHYGSIRTSPSHVAEIGEQLARISHFQTSIEKSLKERKDGMLFSMRGITRHLSAIHEYGSMRQRDEVPLYFDQKK